MAYSHSPPIAPGRVSAQMTHTQSAITMIAQTVQSTVGRLILKARNSFSWIENLHETRAGRMRLQIENRFHLKSKHTTILAEGQVKIDGEKIDLG